MPQNDATATWNSPNEMFFGESEQRRIHELNERDRLIGDQVIETTGNGNVPEPSIPYRVIRRSLFEVKKRIGPSAKKVIRRTTRHWNQRVSDRRRVDDGFAFTAPTASFEVRSLGTPEISAVLASSQADFWVLTREPGQLLVSGIDAVREATMNSSAQVWIGDSRNERGIRTYRPTFSRLLLRQVDALGPVVVVRTSVLREMISHTQIVPSLWPLAIGLHVDPAAVQVIPEVLGVGGATQSELGDSIESACELVRTELDRSGIVAAVQPIPLGRRDVQYVISGQPLVSIVIPTRGTVHDGRAFVVDAVRSIVEKSSYSNYELVIVADEPTPQQVVDDIDRLAGTRVRWVRWSEPFNFSNKMNLGAVCASGKYLLVLNDDIEVVSTDWIERMVSLLGVDGIGHAGALLFFENQTIQHAGHFHRRGAGHVNFGESIRLKDPNQLLVLDQLRAGVTAACSAMTRELFFDIGGFSPQFPGNYNDVDLCCKVRNAGLLNAVSGHARLYHFESITRNAQVQKFELERLFSRWWRYLEHDEYSRGQ